jgi:ParB family chromosome partitioning protein
MNKPKRYERIFWIETEKIKPNPMQPRREFNEENLRSLSDSIRHYGILQPLVVTRKEIETDSGAIVEYELITGERRLRAAQMAGLYQVPVIVHDDEENKIKLELAIIENLQREDLNPIERAQAFKKLVDEFRLRHHEIASRVGKSREYVTNTIRLLLLPVEIQTAVVNGEISEGHCRPILMLSERKEEQIKLYQDIVGKKISVRAAERISRSIAVERARPPRSEAGRPNDLIDPEMKLIEQKLADSLGTAVQIERDGEKRRIKIEFFSDEELQAFLNKIINDCSTDDLILEGGSDLLSGE